VENLNLNNYSKYRLHGTSPKGLVGMAKEDEPLSGNKGGTAMKTKLTIIVGLVAGIAAGALAGGKPSFGASASTGPLSASKDGTKCVTIPMGPIGPTFCSNKKEGESSFGVSTPIGSLQAGGKGSDGRNNFIEVGAGPSVGGFGAEGSVRIPTPSFTRAGITGGTTYDPNNK
jgi:hypothetical protein